MMSGKSPKNKDGWGKLPPEMKNKDAIQWRVDKVALSVRRIYEENKSWESVYFDRNDGGEFSSINKYGLYVENRVATVWANNKYSGSINLIAKTRPAPRPVKIPPNPHEDR